MSRQLKRGEVYLVDLEGGTGSEQCGIRPCLVIQNDIGNKYSPTTIVCPITTKRKNFNATHLLTESLMYTSYIMFEQMRVIDRCRLVEYISCLPEDEMREVNKKIKITLGI